MGVLDGKATVVIGAAGPLSSSFARALAHEGARVLVNDINSQEAERVVAEIKAAGGEAVANTDSVSDWESTERIVEACYDSFGRIDCLVNGAQQFRRVPIWEMTEEALDLTSAVHLKGHFAVTHHAAKRMIKQRSGSIITITSRAFQGHPGMSPYAAVKAGIVGATWTWALELAEYGVRVNCLCPRALDSREDPNLTKDTMRIEWRREPTMAGSSQPGIMEEASKQQANSGAPRGKTVAPLVVYLASDESRWISGQVIFLSGDTLALMHQPEWRFSFKPEGWSFQDLREHFPHTVGAELSQPGTGDARYKWYDGVG